MPLRDVYGNYVFSYPPVGQSTSIRRTGRIKYCMPPYVKLCLVPATSRQQTRRSAHRSTPNLSSATLASQQMACTWVNNCPHLDSFRTLYMMMAERHVLARHDPSVDSSSRNDGWPPTTTTKQQRSPLALQCISTMNAGRTILAHVKTFPFQTVMTSFARIHSATDPEKLDQRYSDS